MDTSAPQHGAPKSLKAAGSGRLKFGLQTLVVLAALVALGLSVYFSSVRTKSVSLRILGAEATSTGLPYSKAGPAEAETEFTGTLVVPPFASRQVRIIPDDCLSSLEIGGAAVPYETWSQGRCDWGRGVLLDLAPFLGADESRSELSFRIRVQNHGGAFGLRIASDQRVLLRSPLILLSLLVIGCALGWFLAGLGFPRAYRWLTLGGVLLRWAYLLVTRFDDRAHDIDAHVRYIQYVAEHWRLPSVAGDWAFFQPPLYYSLCALVYALGGNTEPTFVLLQLFGVVCSTIVLISGIAILLRFSRLVPGLGASASASAGTSAATGAMLLAVWPALIIHSVRLSNDVLLHAFYALGLVLLLRWYEQGRRQDLLWCSVLAALAMLTKANGIGLFLSLIALVLWSWRSRTWLPTPETKMSVRLFVACILIFSIGPAFTLGRSLLAYLADPQLDWLVGQAFNWMNSRLLVANTPYQYCYFDLPAFLREPFISPWLDESGRQFFWNYLLKTALFGEFTFTFSGAGLLAQALSALLLVMFSFPVAAFLLSRAHELKRNAPFLICLAAPILLLLWFRIKAPVSGNADFRYIAPALLPLLVLHGRAAGALSRSGLVVLRLIWTGSALLFCLLSVAFFLLLTLG